MNVCDEIYNSSGYLWRVCRSIYHLNFVIKSLWMTLRWRYLKNNNINVSQNNSLKFVMKYILHIWIKLLWKYCGEWRSDEKCDEKCDEEFGEEFGEISVTQFVVIKFCDKMLWKFCFIVCCEIFCDKMCWKFCDKMFVRRCVETSMMKLFCWTTVVIKYDFYYVTYLSFHN